MLQERLARLALSLAVIRVGAPTEVVLNERMRRTQGALAATQAAVSEGVVAGGGTALLRSAPALDALAQDGEYGRGVDVVRSVLSEPLYWIASNAGYDGQATIDQVKAMGDGQGLDALTGEFGDLFEKGVVDPVRVTRLSLEHAASVAALMLTTEALVAEELIAQPGAIIAPGFGDLAEGWRGRRRRSDQAWPRSPRHWTSRVALTSTSPPAREARSATRWRSTSSRTPIASPPWARSSCTSTSTAGSPRSR